MNKRTLVVFCVSGSLFLIGILAGLIQAILLWKQDGHPAGLIIYLSVLGIGGYAMYPLLRYIFRILGRNPQ